MFRRWPLLGKDPDMDGIWTHVGQDPDMDRMRALVGQDPVMFRCEHWSMIRICFGGGHLWARMGFGHTWGRMRKRM
jgi:hypothetical protein